RRGGSGQGGGHHCDSMVLESLLAAVPPRSALRVLETALVVPVVLPALLVHPVVPLVVALVSPPAAGAV
ncbi:hypothetical protein AAVH_29738, partial [Aphelenchoides avenae]